MIGWHKSRDNNMARDASSSIAASACGSRLSSQVGKTGSRGANRHHPSLAATARS